MGKLKIKKKDVVVPFRETLAYRLIWVGSLLVVFLYSLYQMIITLLSGNTARFSVFSAVGIAAVFGLYYNTRHMREAKMPARTAKRLRR